MNLKSHGIGIDIVSLDECPDLMSREAFSRASRLVDGRGIRGCHDRSFGGSSVYSLRNAYVALDCTEVGLSSIECVDKKWHEQKSVHSGGVASKYSLGAKRFMACGRKGVHIHFSARSAVCVIWTTTCSRDRDIPFLCISTFYPAHPTPECWRERQPCLARVGKRRLFGYPVLLEAVNLL